MKRTITFKTQTLLNDLTNDLMDNLQEVNNAKKSTIKSLLNFSKSLEIKPSTKVENLNFELISN